MWNGAPARGEARKGATITSGMSLQTGGRGDYSMRVARSLHAGPLGSSLRSRVVVRWRNQAAEAGWRPIQRMAMAPYNKVSQSVMPR